MKVWYIPLPSYRERYTEWLSRPNGVFEQMLADYAESRRNFEWGVVRPYAEVNRIDKGLVLDPVVMCDYGFAQTTRLVNQIMNDYIHKGDAIYFEDFWHPGIEMIPYALSLKGLYGKVKLYSHCHAQTADPNDFTSKLMNGWMPQFEEAMCNIYDRVFVASTLNETLMNDNGWADIDRVSIVGTAFNSHIIESLYPPSRRFVDVLREKDTDFAKRLKLVVYTSRLDEEKNPDLFFNIAEATMKKRTDIKFAVLTSANEFRSNDSKVIAKLNKLNEKYSKQFHIFSGLTKNEYYGFLADAAVQINTAKQDFVSMTLLEATMFGCAPFYPETNDSFLEAMCGTTINFSDIEKILMYDPEAGMNVIVERLITLVDWSSKKDVFTSNRKENKFEFIYGKYNRSLLRVFETIENDAKPPNRRATQYGFLKQHVKLEHDLRVTIKEGNAFAKRFKAEVKNGRA